MKSSSKTSHHRDSSGSDSASRHHSALIKVSTAKLRSAPDSKSHTSALLDEGRSAKVIGRKGEWVHLRLDSGREGWVHHDLVEVSKSAIRDKESDSGSRHNSSHSSRHTRTEIADVSSSRHSSHSASHRSSGGHTRQVASIADHGSHATVIPAAPPSSHPANTVVALADTHPKQVSEIADTDSSDDTAKTISNDESPVREASPKSERLVNRALSYRGTPYRMGATGHGAFDCSGFMQYLFSSEGTSLPRTAAEQYAHGRPIAKSDLQPGDLVFFKNTYKAGVSHVGLYIGNNSFVHASSGHSRGVTVTRLDEAYYVNHWAGARRPR